MIPGDKYTHRHTPGLTCQVVKETAKGAQVEQTEGRKSIRAFYYSSDFSDKDKARAIWELVTEGREVVPDRPHGYRAEYRTPEVRSSTEIYCMWATKKGAERWEEEVITEDPTKAEEARKWAEANGYDRIREYRDTLSTAPDFTKVVRK